jgi:plasmid maintenance system antidote protein VapI
MSNLSKLKNLTAQKNMQLVAKHPLHELAFEQRLQYLAAVAMGVALEREPNAAEKLTFLGLAKSLSIDPPDAEEQMKERGSLTEEVMIDLINNIKSLNKPWLYFLDVSWLYAADELLEDNERAFVADLADMLGVEAKHIAVILEFALALKTKNMASIFREKAKLPFDEDLQQVLEQVLRFTQKDMVDVRWDIKSHISGSMQ